MHKAEVREGMNEQEGPRIKWKFVNQASLITK
jgi:hypothetical protein